MAERVRAFDWAATPLGPMDRWPQSLRTAVGICLNSRFPMFIWWGPSLINIYNDSYVPMLGKRHPRALGRPARDSWDDIWSVVGPQADAVMQRGEATWNERVLLVMERSGVSEETYFTWSYSPIPDDSGAIGGLFCAVVEETQRVRTEAALAESERRFRALVTANSSAVYRMNADWTEMQALDGRGFLASSERPNANWMTDYIHPDDQPQVVSAFREAVRTKGMFELEHRVRRADGTTGWTLLRAVPLLDENGQITEWFGAASDVTERKRSEAALRESEERLRQLADAMPQVVWAARPDGTVDYHNRQWHEYTGIPASVGSGGWRGVVHPDDIARVTGLWRDSVRTGNPYEYEFRMRQATTGEYRWFLARAVAVRDGDGNVVRWFGTDTDITDRKAAETERERLLAQAQAARIDAEAANRAKDRFLAVLSHELRTPLTPVAMVATAMEMDPRLPFEFRSDVAMIRRNVDLETRLIDDLLDLSRVISGKLRLNVRPLHVHEVVGHVLATVGAELHEKRLDVETDLRAANDRVEGDPARLQQALWNLLKNAAKFTPEGGRVTVRTRNDADRVLVEVHDTGSGIAPHLLSRIFEPFEQGDVAATTPTHGGLGLGLAIAKAVVDLHGGTIRAASEGVGRGATFTVALPVSVSAAATAPPSSAEPQAQAPLRRLLLVEDHADTARTLVRLLQLDGVDVQWANSMEAALALAERNRFDLVVSDIGLPDGTGYELMRQLRRQHHALPGIAMSGYGMEDDLRQSREAGFEEHLVKPINLPQLRQAIRRVVADAGMRP